MTCGSIHIFDVNYIFLPLGPCIKDVGFHGSCVNNPRWWSDDYLVYITWPGHLPSLDNTL